MKVDESRVCAECQGPIYVNNKVGICGRNSVCKNRAKRESRRRKRLNTPVIGRACDICGGPIRKSNAFGVCRNTADCRREAYIRYIDAYADSHGGSKPYLKTPEQLAAARNRYAKRKRDRGWVLPQDYDLDTGEPIIDYEAVRIASSGMRQVRMTETERALAAEIMVARGVHVREMAHFLHVDLRTAHDYQAKASLESRKEWDRLNPASRIHLSKVKDADIR